MIDEAIHEASAAGLDAGTELLRILPTGPHASLVPQAHFQRVVTRIGDVVLVIEQTINYYLSAALGTELFGVCIAGTLPFRSGCLLCFR